ncbi:MAG: 16S rRNA (adenine(1518)-N(6)/adenine(1519)-N(6))-dimethyltransferase RsmA [Vicinamibacterales bacterium]
MTRARKRFGQHFLEPAWQAKVLAACGVTAADDVVEIGPGRGALTLPLVAAAARVLAIEVDRDLAAALVARALPTLRVVAGDFLDQDWDRLMADWARPTPRPVRVVGNLPYNLSTPILFRLLAIGAAPDLVRDATLMLQAEVAERLVAPPGTAEYGVLTLLTALQADVTPLLAVPPGAFRPVPAVHSALVRLSFRGLAPGVRSPGAVTRLVRAAFTQRRKTLGNALKALATADGLDAAAVLRTAGIDPRRRPETLQLLEFSALADAWLAASGPRPVL